MRGGRVGGGGLTQECDRTGTEPSSSRESGQLMIYLLEDLQLNLKTNSSNRKQVLPFPRRRPQVGHTAHGTRSQRASKKDFCHQKHSEASQPV